MAYNSWMNQSHRDLLEQKGLRPTPARLAILKALETLSKPVDVQEVLDQLEQDQQQIDQATVYRTLDRFVREDVVRQIDFRDGKYRYELQLDHHHHLVCLKCSSVQEIAGDDLLNIDEAHILKTNQFLIQDHALEFFGLCHKCQKK